MGNVINKLSGIRSKQNLPTMEKVPVLVALPDALRCKKSREDTLELSEYSKDFTLDSGGRQHYLIATGQHSKFNNFTSESGKPIIIGKTLNIHPDHFAEAIDLFKPAYMVGLDSPIHPSQNLLEQQKRFQESLNVNARWATDTIALRDKYYPQVKVILPLQTQSIRHLQTYWQRIKSLKCDSVGLPMRCFKRDERLIEFLLGIHGLGIRDAHLLGSSRFGAICVSAYLARQNFFNSISMDSGSWRLAADHGGIFLPYDLRQVHIDDRETLSERTSKLPASWKKRVKNALAHAGRDDEHKFLAEFNYHSIETTIRDIEAHSASPSEMKEFLLERSTRTDDISKIISLLEMIAPHAPALH